MKRINIILTVASITLLQINCKAQLQEPLSPAPCFISEIPKVITLPDSFNLKKPHFIAIFYASCYFDSLGNILEILPQHILIKNIATNEPVKEYYYWKGWEDSAINMSNKEAVKYAAWAMKELPRLTKMKRYPPNIKCTEKITNRNVHTLDYRLE
jgi:hypothetical protein